MHRWVSFSVPSGFLLSWECFTPRTDQIDQIDHDLDTSHSSPAIVRGCAGSAYYRSNPGNRVLDRADNAGLTRQYELEHTDRE